MRKRVLILGSTGSIGRAALEVADALRDEIEICGLAACTSWRELAEQARRCGAGAVALADPSHYEDCRSECPSGTDVLCGAEGLVELIARSEATFVLSAIVGAAGLPPTLEAIRRGVDVGLANKESLVLAGSIIMPLLREFGSRLIPVDSEHSAIFQALHSGRSTDVRRVVLTASGGPFRKWTAERIAQASLDDALRHPTWKMGAKITIDSATMANKALEVIEATHLFDLESDRIDVLVHPESIVHSMVEFNDGAIVAQLGTPDMRIPIQYAMTYPRRAAGPGERMDWRAARSLHFEPPDFERFPALRLGYEAARSGGSSGAVFNAANEAAVERFRAGEIRFGEIARLTERVLADHRVIEQPTLEQLMECDRWARDEVLVCIQR